MAVIAIVCLAVLWVGAFAAFVKAAHYPTLWAAAAASATTGVLGVYVFWIDWSVPH